MSMLKISPELQLPVDAVTETFGILAVKRAGKSNAAVAIAEEMFKAGLPWIAIDPKGDWWGIRSSSDGNGPGLPIHPRIGEGERKVLRTLIDAFPDALTHAELCDRTNYSPDASTIGVILSKLRKLGLVEAGARRVPDAFMEAIA